VKGNVWGFLDRVFGEQINEKNRKKMRKTTKKSRKLHNGASRKTNESVRATGVCACVYVGVCLDFKGKRIDFYSENHRPLITNKADARVRI
jgi:hypothetical protein